jgi:beta-lactamase regulating signal transducer with metallopeptidase domain
MTYSLHSIAISVVAIVLLRLRAGTATQRCAIWRVALFAPFVTASAAAFAGSGQVASVTSLIASRLRVPQRQNVDLQIIRRGSAPAIRRETVDDPFASRMALLIVVLGLGVSAAGGIRFHRRRARVNRELIRRTPCSWVLPLELASVKVSTSRRIRIPIALRRREICLPDSFIELDVDERRSVLLHEAAHVERRDPDWLDAARMLSAITWWQPLNLYLTRMLERDSELAADAHALDAGADGRALVSALAQFASVLEGGALAGAALVHSESPLVHRARAILDREPRTARGAILPVIILAAACAALLFAPRPTTARTVGPASGGGDSRGTIEQTDIRLVRQP